MDIAASLPFIASGFGVGLLVGMTGVGGGSLMTPILILLFGVQTTTAVGTDLLYAAATKGAGTLSRGLSHTVDWKITSRLACGSVPGTTLTIAALYVLDVHGSASPRALNIILGVSLLVSAAGMLFLRRLRWLTVRHQPGAVTARLHVPGTVLAGFVLGVLVTLTSVGAGALGMIVLVLLYTDTPIDRLVGSDIAHAVPLTLIAGCGHWWLGSVNWTLVATLLLGSVPGIVLGSHLSSRMPERVARSVVAAILTVVGARMLGT
jgi:uncharacterized membrane protein YfcA